MASIKRRKRTEEKIRSANRAFAVWSYIFGNIRWMGAEWWRCAVDDMGITIVTTKWTDPTKYEIIFFLSGVVGHGHFTVVQSPDKHIAKPRALGIEFCGENSRIFTCRRSGSHACAPSPPHPYRAPCGDGIVNEKTIHFTIINIVDGLFLLFLLLLLRLRLRSLSLSLSHARISHRQSLAPLPFNGSRTNALCFRFDSTVSCVLEAKRWDYMLLLSFGVNFFFV